MTENLLPCPFCGAVDIFYGSHGVNCQSCFATMPEDEISQDAHAAWNCRSSGWQPIETAPNGRYHASDCSLHNSPALPVTRCSCTPSYERVIVWRGGVRFSYQDENGQWRNMMNRPVNPPSHWMPMPLPPAPQVGDLAVDTPKCKTCFDTGRVKVSWSPVVWSTYKIKVHYQPCPECTPQEITP